VRGACIAAKNPPVPIAEKPHFLGISLPDPLLTQAQ
jgi:hypothetical protein